MKRARGMADDLCEALGADLERDARAARAVRIAEIGAILSPIYRSDLVLVEHVDAIGERLRWPSTVIMRGVLEASAAEHLVLEDLRVSNGQPSDPASMRAAIVLAAEEPIDE